MLSSSRLPVQIWVRLTLSENYYCLVAYVKWVGDLNIVPKGWVNITQMSPDDCRFQGSGWSTPKSVEKLPLISVAIELNLNYGEWILCAHGSAYLQRGVKDDHELLLGDKYYCQLARKVLNVGWGDPRYVYKLGGKILASIPAEKDLLVLVD